MQLYSQASTYNTSCFDRNSSSEPSQKVRSLQEMFAIEQKKPFWVNTFHSLSQGREIIYTLKE